MQALALQVSPHWSGGSIPCRLWPYRSVLSGQEEESHAGSGLTGQSSVVRRKYPVVSTVGDVPYTDAESVL